jgi:endonuclease/exonuclease/phosphatase family metal-dependent hydrolase
MNRPPPSWTAAIAAIPLWMATVHAEPLRLRIATFNVSLNREQPGALAADLRSGTNAQAAQIAAMLQKVRPDIVLLNEFDEDPSGASVADFQKRYLGVGQHGQSSLNLPHLAMPEVNTGVSPNRPGKAVHDFNRDGEATHTPPSATATARERNAYGGDCYGFGTFPGQYGFVVLSRFPLRPHAIRTFQKLLWKDMPGAVLPDDPATPEPGDWYPPSALAVFRLSSKSHIDVPVEVRPGTVVHVLASHPTPPVFDGPEDRNGRRNHDEIRFWADYVRGDAWMKDDAGTPGGLKPDSRFVILGDLNADPHDGDSFQSPARLLLDHPLISAQHTPASAGAVEASRIQGANNARHKGNAAWDTGDFADRGNAPGNLRIDYVLPSKAGFKVIDSGVFWPASGEPESKWIQASDHRLVWVDVEVTE